MRLLLAPIVVTPTKALTPSHVKGLLWLDVLYKGTTRLREVNYLWNLRPYNVTAQTLEYWEYLDRTLGPDVDYSSWSELELSAPYIRMHSEGGQGPFDALRPYLERVEFEGYVHPASRRLLEIWAAQFRLLGVYDPGLATNEPPGLSVEEVVGALAKRSLCIDHRGFGGPVYLDATAEGLPLRHAVSAEGQAIYLVCALRQLLPLIGSYDRVLLVYDKELEADYVLLERILSAFGADVSRLTVGRVPLDGQVASSRHGGWQSYTVDAICRRVLEQFDRAELLLGLRLYFIGVLGRASPQSLRPEVLRKQLLRARRIIHSDGAPVPEESFVEFLAAHVTEAGYVDPYRLTVSLFERHRAVPRRNLLDEVYLG